MQSTDQNLNQHGIKLERCSLRNSTAVPPCTCQRLEQQQAKEYTPVLPHYAFDGIDTSAVVESPYLSAAIVDWRNMPLLGTQEMRDRYQRLHQPETLHEARGQL
eukprot:gnl/TRDRNA2_/TRDRNA2_77547_c1_seq1.p1 gnl/TRDRNA2_/TRDRNA2_77547_c1~~gnl/TRDRNA2_/TRDRNA2_77547_c1_seq1.p1  ORF type:complete len:115 (-),score=1.98 gnl/TRDRNA2_/TRDRNA2_77547_c1_seq1:241-552(-)